MTLTTTKTEAARMPVQAASQPLDASAQVAASILAQCDPVRKERAWDLAQHDQVALITAAGSAYAFQVLSQSGPERSYTVHIHTGTGKFSCTCPDNHRAQICKHLAAAAIWLLAAEKVQELCRARRISEKELADDTLAELAAGVPDEKTAQKLAIIAHVAQRLYSPKPAFATLYCDNETVLKLELDGVEQQAKRNPPITRTELERWLAAHEWKRSRTIQHNGHTIIDYTRY